MYHTLRYALSNVRKFMAVVVVNGHVTLLVFFLLFHSINSISFNNHAKIISSQKCTAIGQARKHAFEILKLHVSLKNNQND